MRRRVNVRRPWQRSLAFFAALALFATGCSVFAEVPTAFAAANEVGDDPFVVAAGNVPPELEAAKPALLRAALTAENSLRSIQFDDPSVRTAEILDARQRAVIKEASDMGLDTIRAQSPSGVGLYGGTGENICDIDGMKTFFDERPDAAIAWASVNGIDTTEIGTYLDDLTAGYLLDSYAVINHGLDDGKAKPFDAIMGTGTAVLVDSDSVPRVRCRCGNPLLPKLSVIDGEAVDSTAFADRVVDANIGDDVPEEPETTSEGFFTRDPAVAIGAPDRRSVGLGDDREASEDRCEFFILLEFVDNRLIDLPGDDLKIVEHGLVESSFVSIGTSPDDLRFVGEIDGGTTSFDISAVVEPGEEISHVRLCDGPENNSSWPGSDIEGSDIDAVAALSSVPK